MSSQAFRSEDGEVSSRVWRFGACEFDESGRELRVAGERIDLESKPLEVLYELLLHAGEVVTKEELLEAAWPGERVLPAAGAHRVRVAVSTLRKLGLKDVIKTVPEGYLLAAEVETVRV